MPTPPDLDLDALERLLEEATPPGLLPARLVEQWNEEDGMWDFEIWNSWRRECIYRDAGTDEEASRAYALLTVYFRNHAPALIAAARTLKNLRDGQECDQMVLVPIRATEAMLNAWTKDMADWDGVTNEDAQEVYRAMLSAHEKGTK